MGNILVKIIRQTLLDISLLFFLIAEIILATHAVKDYYLVLKLDLLCLTLVWSLIKLGLVCCSHIWSLFYKAQNRSMNSYIFTRLWKRVPTLCLIVYLLLLVC